MEWARFSNIYDSPCKLQLNRRKSVYKNRQATKNPLSQAKAGLMNLSLTLAIFINRLQAEFKLAMS